MALKASELIEVQSLLSDLDTCDFSLADKSAPFNEAIGVDLAMAAVSVLACTDLAVFAGLGSVGLTSATTGGVADLISAFAVNGATGF